MAKVMDITPVIVLHIGQRWRDFADVIEVSTKLITRERKLLNSKGMGLIRTNEPFTRGSKPSLKSGAPRGDTLRLALKKQVHGSFPVARK